MSNNKRYMKFGLGILILLVFHFIFASGFTPPGICGEVLRHNQECNIDASPLLYSEVENMAELEKGVALMRLNIKNNRE